jgi:hypothetical protein
MPPTCSQQLSSPGTLTRSVRRSAGLAGTSTGACYLCLRCLSQCMLCMGLALQRRVCVTPVADTCACTLTAVPLTLPNQLLCTRLLCCWHCHRPTHLETYPLHLAVSGMRHPTTAPCGSSFARLASGGDGSSSGARLRSGALMQQHIIAECFAAHPCVCACVCRTHRCGPTTQMPSGGCWMLAQTPTWLTAKAGGA